MNHRQLAALTDPFNPQSNAEAVAHLARVRQVGEHGDGSFSIVVLAVDR
jgi:hypothetical protein